jgi:Nitrile hydratase, alpha chain
MTTDKGAPIHGHTHGYLSDLPFDAALRVMTLESLLVEKGLVDPKALAALIDTYEHKTGPRNGARRSRVDRFGVPRAPPP